MRTMRFEWLISTAWCSRVALGYTGIGWVLFGPSTTHTALTVPTTKLGRRRTGVFGGQINSESSIGLRKITVLVINHCSSPAQFRRGYGRDCISYFSCTPGPAPFVIFEKILQYPPCPEAMMNMLDMDILLCL